MGSKHCLVFNLLAGCKQGNGGSVGLCVSISLRVHFLEYI